MRKVTLVVAAGILVALVLGCGSPDTTAANPFVGTWKMNPAKSRSSSPLLGSFKLVVSNKGFVQDWVDTDGKAFHFSWTGESDGKDYPFVGDPDKDTYSQRWIGPNTLEYVAKKAGKETGRGQVVVSKDGKTYTDTGREGDVTYSIFMEKQ
jgi:hypothetical protein